ncbi:MAG TPA: NAD(P)-binding domain-containing protein [Actinomycetota bacterium]|nr:NAD(P)-binding domain-containing protein [Actinomycetota bacterium]
MQVERFDTVVIGGGQAGLSAAHHLKRAERSFVVLDANERIGDNWRQRYDSLRLFTPARYIGLPGDRFPGPGSAMPARDEMADYLESYVARFALPVRTGVRVDRLSREGETYVVTAGERRFEAENVIVASGAHRDPRVPAVSRELDPRIVQLHSSEYRNPSQISDGPVLVVGAGNSGGDIAIELVRTHATYLSGRERGHVPVDIDGRVARFVGVRFVVFFGRHVLTRRNPIGRRALRKSASHGDPLVRVKPKQLVRAGVRRVPKVMASQGGLPLLEDGRVLSVDTVVWCTGFRHDLSWVDLPVFGEDGAPMHERGVVTSEPGLYFVGLPFQFAFASDVLPGVGRDAAYVVRQLVRRSRRGAQTGSSATAGITREVLLG